MRFMTLASAAFALLASSAFAQDKDRKQDGEAIKKRILEAVEKRLKQEEEKLLQEIAKLIDEELAKKKAVRPSKHEPKPAPESPKNDPPKKARGYLGIQPAEAGDEDGVVVGRVFEDSPAAKAGIKDGDRIVAVDGTAVKDIETLKPALEKRGAGSELLFKIVRDGEEMEIKVTLGRHPEDKEETPKAPAPSEEELRRRIMEFMKKQQEREEIKPLFKKDVEGDRKPARGTGAPWLGVMPEELSDDLRAQLDLEAGVGLVVIETRAGSPAEKELRKGDILLKIDGGAIRGEEGLQKFMAGAKVGQECELTILRKGKSLQVKLTLAERKDK